MQLLQCQPTAMPKDSTILLVPTRITDNSNATIFSFRVFQSLHVSLTESYLLRKRAFPKNNRIRELVLPCSTFDVMRKSVFLLYTTNPTRLPTLPCLCVCALPHLVTTTAIAHWLSFTHAQQLFKATLIWCVFFMVMCPSCGTRPLMISSAYAFFAHNTTKNHRRSTFSLASYKL